MGFSFSQKLQIAEIFFSLLIARLRVKFSTQRWLSEQWGTLHYETPRDLPEDQREQVQSMMRNFSLMEVNTSDRFNCRITALAAKWMLNRRGISSTVYVGFRKSLNDDAIEGHAWLRSGNMIVTGSKQKHSFRIVSCYGSDPQ